MNLIKAFQPTSNRNSFLSLLFVQSRTYSTTHHKHPTGHHHSHIHTESSTKKEQSSKPTASSKKAGTNITDTPVSIFEQPEVDINERSTEPLPWDREREGKILEKKLSDIDEIKWREAEDRQIGSIIYRRAEEVCIENHDHALPQPPVDVSQQYVNDDKPLDK
ncbi:predicted protein [Naegleria gruberi]|uniref:Predicted protein n=1 Tax=Naegleria gruberi TaxID=5762 RepID=D2VF86_NAEGR|nr:uncharacterized protein NAEGRDRAFT_49057 [Naegleria gruberi]EFC44325.1 predicted protein [Naegleria gruberi]|eukprot:XP_002677069.1 predicted protein [Naegleria gruberi strain NEG-M]